MDPKTFFHSILWNEHPNQCGVPLKHMANALVDPLTGATLEYNHLIAQESTCETWHRSFANELGGLTQGIHGRV